LGFCTNTTPTCDTCYEIADGNCTDVLNINLGINPATTYYLNLIDKFDITTELTITTDGAGNFTITQTWTEFSGAVEVEIYSDAARTVKVSFTISGTSYNCIILKQ
tara:strand:- start:241 stop:558 length:318 start_codon:yes stop_codon:yes gene_type:complete